MKHILIIAALHLISSLSFAGNGSGTMGQSYVNEAVKYIGEDRGQIEFQFHQDGKPIQYIKARAEELVIDQKSLDALNISKENGNWAEIQK